MRCSLRWLIVFWCVAVCAATVPDPSTRARIEQLWRDASAAQQAQQYSRAAALYGEILSLQPDLLEAEVNFGLMRQLTGDLRAAIDAFQHVLRKSPELYAPNLLTGLDYLKLGSPDAALPYLKRATAAKPDDAKARTGLANSYLQLRRYSEAQEEFSRAVEGDGKNGDAWYGLGAAYLGLEREAESRLRPGSPFRRVLLGDSYLQQGRPAEAVKVLKPVLDGSSPVPCAHSLLGFAYLRDGKKDEAARQFQMDWNAEAGSGCLTAKVGLAAVAAERDDIDTALRELREATAIDSAFIRNNAELFWKDFAQAGAEARAREILGQSAGDKLWEAMPSLAETYFNKGQYSACSAALAGMSASRSVLQLHLLARCSYYIGRDDLVLKASGLLLKSAPADEEAIYWRVQSLERLGWQTLAKATETNPDSPSLHVLWGDMLRSKGSFTEATAEYRKALTLKPDFLAARLGLARALYWDNQREDAQHELQSILGANPTDPEASYLMGEILISRQEFTKALPLLLTGLHAAPEELPLVHAALSKTYDECGDLPRAISELKQALRADGDGSYHYRLSRLYAKAGNQAAAAEALEKSKQLRAQSDSSVSVTLP